MGEAMKFGQNTSKTSKQKVCSCSRKNLREDGAYQALLFPCGLLAPLILLLLYTRRASAEYESKPSGQVGQPG